MGVTRRGFNWGVACAFDMNMVPEAIGKKLEPMVQIRFTLLYAAANLRNFEIALRKLEIAN